MDRTIIFIILILSFAGGRVSAEFDGLGLSTHCKSNAPYRVESEGRTEVVKPASFLDSITNIVKVGEGSFGKVYKGSYFGKPIALKKMLITEDNVQEINNLLALKGTPGVPEIYECEKGVQHLYMMQEQLFLDMTKEDSLDVLRAKPFTERLKLYIELVATLKAIHEHDLLHHDIKTENIMAGNEKVDRLFLIDYGLTKDKMERFRGGSRLFYSPELVNNKRHYSNDKDDIWAIALSIAEMEASTVSLFTGSYSICVKSLFLANCQSGLIKRIDQHIDNTMDKYREDCSRKGVEDFRRALKTGLEFNEEGRPGIAQLKELFENVLSACAVKPEEAQAQMVGLPGDVASRLPSQQAHMRDERIIEKQALPVSTEEALQIPKPSNEALNFAKDEPVKYASLAENKKTGITVGLTIAKPQSDFNEYGLEKRQNPLSHAQQTHPLTEQSKLDAERLNKISIDPNPGIRLAENRGSIQNPRRIIRKVSSIDRQPVNMGANLIHNKVEAREDTQPAKQLTVRHLNLDENGIHTSNVQPRLIKISTIPATAFKSVERNNASQDVQKHLLYGKIKPQQTIEDAGKEFDKPAENKISIDLKGRQSRAMKIPANTASKFTDTINPKLQADRGAILQDDRAHFHGIGLAVPTQTTNPPSVHLKTNNPLGGFIHHNKGPLRALILLPSNPQNKNPQDERAQPDEKHGLGHQLPPPQIHPSGVYPTTHTQAPAFLLANQYSRLPLFVHHGDYKNRISLRQHL